MKNDALSTRRNRFNLFIKHSLVGGLTVLLPMVIVLLFLRWLYDTLSAIVSPFAGVLQNRLYLSDLEANIILLLALVLVCFLLGNFVSTRVGDWVWQKLEAWLVRRIPGYRMVRDLVMQLMGDKKNSAAKRGEVANLWLYGRDTPISVTGMITARHADGRVTVFVPCGPNPTTGFVYHVDASLVDLCPHIRVEQLMKMVVACGAGSQPLLASRPARPGSDKTPPGN
jgi:uncharacterized membrane protein